MKRKKEAPTIDTILNIKKNERNFFSIRSAIKVTYRGVVIVNKRIFDTEVNWNAFKYIKYIIPI